MKGETLTHPSRVPVKGSVGEALGHILVNLGHEK